MSTQHPFNRDRKDDRNTRANTRHHVLQHAYVLINQFLDHFGVYYIINPIFWLIFAATMSSFALKEEILVPTFDHAIFPQSDPIDRMGKAYLFTSVLCMVGYPLLLSIALVFLIGCVAGCALLLGVISLSIGLAHGFAALLEDFERDYANVHHLMSSTSRQVVFVLRHLLYHLDFLVIFILICGITTGTSVQWNLNRIENPDRGDDSLAFHIGAQSPFLSSCGLELLPPSSRRQSKELCISLRRLSKDLRRRGNWHYRSDWRWK